MDSFNRSYIWLSLLFIVYFYIVPLSIISYSDIDWYVGKNLNINKSDIFLAWVSIFIFLLGWSGFDFSYKLYNRQLQRNDSAINLNSNSVNILFWFFFAVYIIYSIILLSDGSRASDIYAVRSGQSEGSLVSFFLMHVFSALKISIVIVLLSDGRAKLAMFVLLVSIFVAVTGATGRASLMVSLCLFFIVSFRFSSGFISKLAFYCSVLLLPVILNLKSIIYSIAVEQSFPSIIDIFTGDVDYHLYLLNFGHIAYSMLNVDSLIDLVGYRYFYDYIQGFLFYFKLFGWDVGSSITYFNTESIMGVHSSIIPPGYLAMGYVQLGLLGVFFSGALYRLIGYLCEYVYNKIGNGNSASCFYLSFIAANSFYHGDVRIMVMTIFFPLAAMLIFNKLFRVNFKL